MQVDSILAAFPEPIAGAVAPALEAASLIQVAPVLSFEVATVLGPVSIPYRIHNDVPTPEASLPDVQRLAVSCLYTRHHDGRVRERHLRSIVGSADPWVVPFVVQLVGEYVVEIVDVIRQQLLDKPADRELRTTWGEFVGRNPVYWARTESRVMSYWSCYYRWRWRRLNDYPGYLVARWARQAAEQVGASLLPTRLPADRSSLVLGS